MAVDIVAALQKALAKGDLGEIGTLFANADAKTQTSKAVTGIMAAAKEIAAQEGVVSGMSAEEQKTRMAAGYNKRVLRARQVQADKVLEGRVAKVGSAKTAKRAKTTKAAVAKPIVGNAEWALMAAADSANPTSSAFSRKVPKPAAVIKLPFSPPVASPASIPTGLTSGAQALADSIRTKLVLPPGATIPAPPKLVLPPATAKTMRAESNRLAPRSLREVSATSQPMTSFVDDARNAAPVSSPTPTSLTNLTKQQLRDVSKARVAEREAAIGLEKANVKVERAAARALRLSAETPFSPSDLSQATTAAQRSTAAMSAMAGIAAEAEDFKVSTPTSRIPGIPLDPKYIEYANGVGKLAPLKTRMAGVPLRAAGALGAVSMVNEFAVDRLANKFNVPTRISGAVKGATLGATAGATIGAPFFGVGAGVGAAVGGVGGGLLGAIMGGGGGSKGDFDEESIRAIPDLSDRQKESLITEYTVMVQMGTPKSQAAQEVRTKALQLWQSTKAQQEQYATMLPNIMALQGAAAKFAKPYYDDFRASNDVQRDLAYSSAAQLPANQQASARAFAGQQHAQGIGTAAAYAQSNLLAPAFYLQDALRQNAYSSGAPPLGGLGLSGSLGVQGGGGAVPSAIEELMKSASAGR